MPFNSQEVTAVGAIFPFTSSVGLRAFSGLLESMNASVVGGFGAHALSSKRQAINNNLMVSMLFLFSEKADPFRLLVFELTIR